MLLSEGLVLALDEGYMGNISGIKIFCDENTKESVAEFFVNEFSKEWNEALSKVEMEYGSCDEENVPAKIIYKDYGFLISLRHLEITYCMYEQYDYHLYGCEALKTSLKNLKAKYQQVEYEGYIGQLLSDVNGGEVWQEEISSITGKNVETYDFIGEILNDIFEKQICTSPCEQLDANDVKFAVTGRLDYFGSQERITEIVEELGGKVVSGVSKNTDYLINNDINANSAKNKKAKELGIPIIGEMDFIRLFCDPEEYKSVLQSPFWLQVSEHIGDYAEMVKTLYAYSKYIKKEYLDRAVRGLGICIDESIKEGKLEDDDKSKFLELVKELENN